MCVYVIAQFIRKFLAREQGVKTIRKELSEEEVAEEWKKAKNISNSAFTKRQNRERQRLKRMEKIINA